MWALLNLSIEAVLKFCQMGFFRDQLADTALKAGIGGLGVIVVILLVRELFRLITANKGKLTALASLSGLIYYFGWVYHA